MNRVRSLDGSAWRSGLGAASGCALYLGVLICGVVDVGRSSPVPLPAVRAGCDRTAETGDPGSLHTLGLVTGRRVWPVSSMLNAWYVRLGTTTVDNIRFDSFYKSL